MLRGRELVNRRSLLWKVLMISLAFHVGAILGLGPLVIFKYLFKKEVEFTTGPEIERRIDPRKLEFKVKVKESQRKSGRPKVQPRMTAQRVADMNLPDIDIEVASIKTKALPTMRNFSSMGFGTGLGDGSGQGGLGTGESAVNFFGIKSRGERVAFLVDVSASMLEDTRGGIPGFNAIKEELYRMVRGLSGSTFFNVITFAENVDIFQTKMVLANRDNVKEMRKWIQPYNIDTRSKRYGVLYNNYKPQTLIDGYNVLEGTTRLDMAITAAMEMNADTIFILTDGRPLVRKELPADEWEAWQKKYHSKQEQAKVARMREKWEKDLEKENIRRAKKGLPPMVSENPPSLLFPMISDEEIIEYVEALQKQLYETKGSKPCRIHVVGYETEQDVDAFLRQLASDNKGRFRRLKNKFKPVLKDHDTTI